MRNCMKPRGPCEAPLEARGKQDKLAADWGKPRRVRGQPLKDRGKRKETKSLLEHLIRLIEERKAAAEGQAAEKKEYG